MITNTLNILSWQSKGLSSGNFVLPNTNFSPLINYVGSKIRIKFTGSCLKQSNKISYTHKKIVHIYIVYEINVHTTGNNYPTLENCLFGAVTLTKKADNDKCRYSEYEVGFDRRGEFPFPGGGYGQNVIIFGEDMSFSAHIDNKKRHINIRNRSNTRIRKYFNYRKNVFF